MVIVQKYEIMILLTEEFNENEINAWVLNLGKLLKQFHVSDLSIISLATIKLSYSIQRKMKATYIQVNFCGIPKFINYISKVLQTDSHILRFLVIHPS